MAVAVGIGLSAFYALPSILELDAVRIRGMTTGYQDFHRHFVHPAAWFDWVWGYAPSGSGESGQVSTQIGIVQWMVVAAALAGVTASSPRGPRRVAFVGWLAVVIYALFMMTAALSGDLEPNRTAGLHSISVAIPDAADRRLQRAGGAGARTGAEPYHPGADRELMMVALQWSVTRTYWGQAWDRERAAIAIDVPDWWVSRNANMWGFPRSRL